MKKTIAVVFVVVIIASILASGGKFSGAAANADDAGVLSKLEEVINGQAAILKDIAYIKSELAVIKIRITQQQ